MSTAWLDRLYSIIIFALYDKICASHDIFEVITIDLLVGNVGQGSDEGLVDVDPPQEDILVKTLVVLVEERLRVIHRDKSQSGNPDMAQVASVRRSGTDDGINFKFPEREI